MHLLLLISEKKKLEQRNIKITTQNKDLTDFDKEMLMRAGIQIAPRIFNKGYEKERF